jgi:hypothetical protein
MRCSGSPVLSGRYSQAPVNVLSRNLSRPLTPAVVASMSVVVEPPDESLVPDWNGSGNCLAVSCRICVCVLEMVLDLYEESYYARQNCQPQRS